MQPRITAIIQPGRRVAPVLPVEPVTLETCCFTIELAGVHPGDYVVAYLDTERVGHCVAEGLSLALKCLTAVVPKRGYVLSVMVIRIGCGPISLPLVNVNYEPPPALTFRPPVHLPPKEAFVRMPSIDVVPEASTADLLGGGAGTADPGRFYPREAWWWRDNGTPGVPKEEGGNPIGFLEHRFHLPAHFPLLQFGGEWPAPPGEGLVIHEGMRFFADNNGHYEVQFSASAPAMPVTVHLQMVVEDSHGCFFTLSLPPIRILPDRDAQGVPQPRTWQIRHTGYSREVQERFHCLSTVKRYGAARFGSPPPP